MERNRQHLNLRKFGALAVVLTLGTVTVFSLLTGCESTPSEPVYENPFDPLGPDAGDPLQLQAQATNDTTIRLTWNQPQDMGIERYVVSTSAYRDSGWAEAEDGQVDHTSNPVASYPYTKSDPTSTHWFRVQAFTSTDFTITSYATPDSATTGPRVIVGEASGTTATRFVSLEITVTEGEQLRIALDETFTESLLIVPAGAPGDSINLSYDLGPAAGNNEIKTLYVVSFSDGFESVPSVQDIRVDFTPAFQVVDNPATLASRTVDLTIPTEGVQNMRFFAEWADTVTTPWVPVSEFYSGYELSDSANPQFIRGQFQGNFGFNNLQEIQVTPDLLDNITFNLVFPDSARDDHVTDLSVVRGASNAAATQMRYSESADFTDVPWIAYADTVLITLSPTPGHKVIYVQYRNDWTQSGILTDFVVHVAQAAEVIIWAPVQGDIVQGGVVFQVQGASTVGSGEGSVILVKFDGGDGNGFVDVTGTDTWSYLWNVPLFKEDTPLIIRARAFFGPNPAELDTVTTAITVTVTQLAVAITKPLDGATLLGNRAISFTGTAAGILGGDSLDLVTVDIGDEQFEASGTTNWSLGWNAPLWDADTTLTVVATAWADGDTAQHTIGVSVNRPAVAVLEPRHDDLVDGDFDLTIAGVTFSDLFSDPVESVVVDVAYDDVTEQVAATGTDSWSAVWHTPVVEANTRVEIIATATAGAESKADTLSVTVKP